jgi:hypothetical protein
MIRVTWFAFQRDILVTWFASRPDILVTWFEWPVNAVVIALHRDLE